MLEAKFNLITENARTRPATVEVAMGRKVAVAKASGSRAFFEFHELCEMPLGAADYIALCSKRRLLLFAVYIVYGLCSPSYCSFSISGYLSCVFLGSCVSNRGPGVRSCAQSFSKQCRQFTLWLPLVSAFSLSRVSVFYPFFSGQSLPCAVSSGSFF
jgi:hypothetical protein